MLKAVLPSLDGLSDDAKAHYEERDGKFFLQVETVDGYALEDVGGLKNSLSAARSERDAATTKLKAFDGLDAQAAREALTKVEEMDGWTPEKKVQEKIDAAVRQLTSKHEAEIGKKDERITGLRGEIEKHLVDAVATAALGEHKGNVNLLLPHVKASIKVVESDDGSFHARIVGDDGNPRLTMKPGSTDPMTIGEFVETMKSNDSYKAAFDGTGSTGSGAESQGRTTPASGPHTISAADAQDHSKYKAAKAKATEAGTTLTITE